MLGTAKDYLECMDKLSQYEALGTVEELSKKVNEEDVLKFYYCESLDKYLVGLRVDTMYYAEITKLGDLSFIMSRYLPWGQHIESPTSAWQEYTYPSEPVEISFTEWLKGFMKRRINQ